jgi:release factor H-coupled RctB family protein
MGNSPERTGRAPVHNFLSAGSWVEGAALDQLNDVASRPGIRAVAGFPDLHPGKYGPVGAAILADAVHPLLVGSDIGCGMGLYALDRAARKLRVEQAAARLAEACEGVWNGDRTALLAQAGLAATSYDASIGTVGGGNHFCEVQAIDRIEDLAAAQAAGLDRDGLFVLVHSGSRGLGADVLAETAVDGAVALDPSSSTGRRYLERHDHAMRWAAVNRSLIARRAAEALRADHRIVADVAHNFAVVGADGVLHRKGAAPADRGLVPVPGSRGTLSYLVAPCGDAPAIALASLAHGAGRKFDRASMIGRAGRTRSEREALARNPYGGVVICEDRSLMIEEAPTAYKAIDQVIDDLVAHGLVRVVATFKPLITFKRSVTERHADAREARHDRDAERRQQRRRREEDRR